MKLFKTRVAAGIGILGLSLFGIGCGGDGGDEGGGADKGGSGGGAEAGKSLEAQMVGFWAPDADAFFEMVKANIPPAALADAKVMEEAKAQAEEMANQMVIHFDGSNSVMYGPGAPEKATYVITSTDEATKTLMATITDADGTENKGKAILDGDSMELIKLEEDGEENLKLVRITEAQFKERIPEPAE